MYTVAMEAPVIVAGDTVRDSGVFSLGSVLTKSHSSLDEMRQVEATEEVDMIAGEVDTTTDAVAAAVVVMVAAAATMEVEAEADTVVEVVAAEGAVGVEGHEFLICQA